MSEFDIFDEEIPMNEKELRAERCERLVERFRGEDLNLDDLRWFFEQGYNFAVLRLKRREN